MKTQEGGLVSGPRAPQTIVGLARSKLTAPLLYNVQADLPAQQTGIGPVVTQCARRQVKLVDEGRALVEGVVDPEIESRIGEPARAAVDPVTDVDVDSRPGINSARRDRARIPVGTGVVQDALRGPAPGRPQQLPDQPQARWVAYGIHEVKDRRLRGYLLPLINRMGAQCGGGSRAAPRKDSRFRWPS